jgi:hypothetical protein
MGKIAASGTNVEGLIVFVSLIISNRARFHAWGSIYGRNGVLPFVVATKFRLRRLRNWRRWESEQDLASSGGDRRQRVHGMEISYDGGAC